VFKGGTCLAKVYAEFYRLSEDMDFMISTPIQAKRAERSKQAATLKQAMAELPRLNCSSMTASRPGMFPPAHFYIPKYSRDWVSSSRWSRAWGAFWMSVVEPACHHWRCSAWQRKSSG